MRYLDATRISKYFARNNYKIVNKPKDADIIFFLTCGAFDHLSDESLRMVKEFQKYEAELIVGGCLPEIEKDKLNSVFQGRTINTKDLDKDPDKMDELFPENIVKFRDVDDANASFSNLNEGDFVGAVKNFLGNIGWLEKILVNFQTQIFKSVYGKNSFFYNIMVDEPMYRMRISWGCNSNCSYCGIKQAIGTHKSKPLEKVLEEFKFGLKNGHKHFMMNADDIGAYGTDIGSSFSELLDKMTSIDGEYFISIANLSPRWVIKYIDHLEDLMKREKIIRIGVPVQSGSNRILKLMNRFHDKEKIKDALIRLKTVFPKLSLHTHIIVGFPTETDEEFKQTLDFIKDCKFSAGQLMPFSSKSGSEAASIEPKIPMDEINKRLIYAKSFFKKEGYSVKYKSQGRTFLFDKQDYYR
ncbi:MAG: radical SAM protein [Thermoplasmatales archaeon]|nr:MAG: radical SAM protein [Thermoplasmatales archaeon]